jgi:hypothetical protein
MLQIPRRPIVIGCCSLTVAAACAFLAGCAASPPNSDLGPERLAQLGHICADTMQLDPGNAHFEDCMAVLGDTARKLDRAEARP